MMIPALQKLMFRLELSNKRKKFILIPVRYFLETTQALSFLIQKPLNFIMELLSCSPDSILHTSVM